MPAINSSYEVESGFSTTLKNSISASQTSNIIINKVPTITSGVLNFDINTASEEWIGFGSITDNGDGTATLGDVTRGLTKVLNDFTGSSSRAFSHSGGVCKVVLVDYHALFNLKANKDRENVFTADQTIGTGKILKFTDSNVTIRRDGNDLKFKDLSQPEIALSTLASLSGSNDKVKVSVADTTEGLLNNKLTVGSGLTKTIVNPGANEELNLAINPSALTGINFTYGESITAGQSVILNASDGKVYKGGGYRTIGIAAENGVLNDVKKVIPIGQVATVPAFSLSDRDVAAINTGQNNVTGAITTDTLSTTTEWRSQSFTPVNNQDNVKRVRLQLTNNALSGWTVNVKIFATSSGVPTGSALATVTATAASIFTGTNTFVLSTPLALTPGTEYAVVLHLSGSGSGNIAWTYGNTNPYTTGQRSTSATSGSSWVADPTSDYLFYVDFAGIIGEAVYLGNSGVLQLGPTSSTHLKIGDMISPTQMLVNRGTRSLEVILWYTGVGSAVVDTEFLIGFRARKISFTAVCFSSGGSGSVANDFITLNPLTGRYNFTFNNGGDEFSSGSPDSQLGYSGVLASGATAGYSVQAVTNTTLTIRRAESAGNTGASHRVYLTIEE